MCVSCEMGFGTLLVENRTLCYAVILFNNVFFVSMNICYKYSGDFGRDFSTRWLYSVALFLFLKLYQLYHFATNTVLCT